MAKETADRIIDEAMECVHEGDYERALQVFYLCQDYNNPRFLHGKATALLLGAEKLDLRIIEEVAGLYEQAKSLDSNWIEPYLMLGLTYSKKADLEIAQLEQTSSIESNLPIINTLHLAEVNLRKALELNPHFDFRVKMDLEYVQDRKEFFQGELH